MNNDETNTRLSRNGANSRVFSSFGHSNFVIRHSFDGFEFRHSNFRAKRGFTLIELMISIALVLFLILGVNQVFQYTTQAVGAGEAINTAIRSSRAAQATFAEDFASMVPPGSGPTDSASLIISSQQAYAYRNKADLAAEGNYSGATVPTSVNGATIPAGAPFQDFANSGTFGDPNVPGDVTMPYTYNSRNHRLDVLSFFARDLFHRQTGNPGTFVDDLSSGEALVWYGHLQLPDNGGFDAYVDFPHTAGAADTFPCAGSPATNPNNCFGSQLVLGRVTTLLVPKTGTTLLDNSKTPQWFVNNATGLDPLALTSQVTGPSLFVGTDSGPSPFCLPDSRVDLAATSIAAFRTTLLNAIASNGAGYNWWDLMMDGNPTYSSGGHFTRFKCNPFLPKPMQAVNMAMASPYFLSGCSQFTVEFAGDYVSQVNDPGSTSYGQLIPNTVNASDHTNAVVPDGQVDYQIVTDTTTGLKRKQIVWYGLPRNTSGLSGLSTTNGDVAPVYYWITSGFPTSTGYGVSFNSGDAQPSYPYYFEKTAPVPLGNALTSMQNGATYICAWSPKDVATNGVSLKPKLIRITLTLEDPTGRLPEGQTYQYVFAVP